MTKLLYPLGLLTLFVSLHLKLHAFAISLRIFSPMQPMPRCGFNVNNDAAVSRGMSSAEHFRPAPLVVNANIARMKGRENQRRTRLCMSSSPSGSRKGLMMATIMASTSSLVVVDVQLRRYFQKAGVVFPSSLAGCGIVFALLIAAYMINPDAGDHLYDLLNPGATFLAKWLPVFFVPSLVTLPLSEPLESSFEVLRVGVVLIGGFLFTLLTTSLSVLAVRKLQGGTVDNSDHASSSEVTIGVPQSQPKAFSRSTLNFLSACSLLGGILTAASKSQPANTLFLLFTTLSSFVFGARMPSKFTKLVHPLVTCTALTWISAKIMGLFTARSFTEMLRSYKTGSACPMHKGAGDILLFMLGPAVVALACQMYNRKELMRENMAEVGTAVVASSVGGLFSTALMVRLVQIANPSIRLSLLSRNITSPLAMAIASILGADVSLAVSMVVISGLIGANFGATIYDALGIQDPVARGLGVGAAAHGLGTAAFANETDAFPFAAIAMALTASCSTVLVTIPVLRKSLIRVALGV